MQAKVVCSEAAVRITQDVMTIFGGTAFATRLPFERYFRNAPARMVMGMAHDAAYQNMVPRLFPDSASATLQHRAVAMWPLRLWSPSQE